MGLELQIGFKMNQKKILISSLLIATAMMSLIMPVMAKPNTVTVIVKDANGNPVHLAQVQIFCNSIRGTEQMGQWYTDNRGKALCDVTWYIDTYGVPVDTIVEIKINGVSQGTIKLNPKFGGRLSTQI